jgi:probable rRNA maturation factor
MFEIDISNQQDRIPVDTERLQQAVLVALKLEAVQSAVLSISIVDNATIHEINREHLQHDYPTDVISFQLDFSQNGLPNDEFDDDAGDSDEDNDAPPGSEIDDSPAFEYDDEQPADEAVDPRPAFGAFIEGEIIASAEMAEQMAAEGHWNTDSELLLYVVHGLLHICGYDDLSAPEKAVMRTRERCILDSLGLHPVYPQDEDV